MCTFAEEQMNILLELEKFGIFSFFVFLAEVIYFLLDLVFFVFFAQVLYHKCRCGSNVCLSLCAYL